MREHTARPHKLLYGFHGELFWNIALRGEEIIEEEVEEEEEKVEYDEDGEPIKKRGKGAHGNEKKALAGGIDKVEEKEKKYGPERKFM